MLVSTSWLDYTYFNDSTSTCCKVVFVYLGPSQPGVESGRTYVMIAQVASKYTQTLSGLHGLIDTYSLGINWNGHRSGLDKMSCSINFVHFSGVKNHLLSPHILHMNCFLYPWTSPRAKKYLICELLSSRLPPSGAQKRWLWAVPPQASSDCFMHYW